MFKKQRQHQQSWLIGRAQNSSSIGLFVCLSVSSITHKNYEQIMMKFYGGVQGGERKK